MQVIDTGVLSLPNDFDKKTKTTFEDAYAPLGALVELVDQFLRDTNGCENSILLRCFKMIHRYVLRLLIDSRLPVARFLGMHLLVTTKTERNPR